MVQTELAKKKLKSLVMPIRGGTGKQKRRPNHKRKKSRVKHQKSPSMMQQGIPPMPFTNTMDMNTDVLMSDIPQVPMMGGMQPMMQQQPMMSQQPMMPQQPMMQQDMYMQQQMQMQQQAMMNHHLRQNSFVQQ